MKRCVATFTVGPLALVLFGLAALVSSGGAPAQPQKPPESKAPPKVKSGPLALGQRIRALLNDTLDMRSFQQPMTLKEALGEIQKQLNEKYKEEDALPILVDAEAFKEENPDAPDLFDTQVMYPPFPRRMTVATALWLALSKAPTNNVTYLVRRGFVEITTRERVKPWVLFSTKVLAQFDRRPLDEAMAELSEQSGVSIVLDPRVGAKAKAPVSATFRNTTALEAAVALLAEMAELHVRHLDSDILFVTEKEKGAEARRGGVLRFRNTPLDQALRELAEWSKRTIVLAPHAGEEAVRDVLISRSPAKALVTATFQPGTEPGAAARILAELAGLRAVDIGNAVLVTSREAALALQQATWQPSAPKK